MVTLSATDFFSKAFTWLADISAKLPKIDFKTYFIVVISLLIGIGVITALTFFGSYRFKLTAACKKIIRYLSDVEFIDDDNVSDFTSQCFSAKAPSILRDCWVQYLGVRFGYPSDIVSEHNVYDKEVKRVREIRANVFIAIALLIIAVFSFWGYGTLEGRDMGVIFCASLALAGIIYLVLVIINRSLSKVCLDTLSAMQEDLDAKVILQVEKSFATDSSPLAELSAIVDEIVARNTAKDIGFDFGESETPIELLIAQSDMFAEAQPQNDAQNSDVQNSDVQDEINVEAVNDSEQESDADGLTGVTDSEESAVEIANAEVADEEPSEFEEAAETESETDIAETVGTEMSDGIDGELTEDAPVEEISDSEYDAETEETEQNEEADLLQKDYEQEEAEVVVEEDEIEEAVEGIDEDADEESAVANGTQLVEEDITEEAVCVEEDESQVETEIEGSTEEDDIDGEAQLAEDADETLSDEEAAGDVNANDNVKVLVVDEYAEDDENVKAAKLVKMPNLVDYMLSHNPSRRVMMNIATILLSAYKKFENSEEDKKIVVGCMKKVMNALLRK